MAGSPDGNGAMEQSMISPPMLAPFVAGGLATCARCGETIEPGTAWDLGHDDLDRRSTRGPSMRAATAPHRIACTHHASGSQLPPGSDFGGRF